MVVILQPFREHVDTLPEKKIINELKQELTAIRPLLEKYFSRAEAKHSLDHLTNV